MAKKPVSKFVTNSDASTSGSRGKLAADSHAHTEPTADYRHKTAKRKNNPPAKIAAEGTVPAIPKARYAYSPHLAPVLRFDPTADADRASAKVAALIEKAAKGPLSAEDRAVLAEALANREPWLEWATKREQHQRGYFEVDPVALHIHERVSAQAVMRVASRQDVTHSLFADPEQQYHEAVQFYRHDIDWANRLILGDSLQVMSSLARREDLAGKVQMIYMDPPYGIKFASNFQPEVGKRDVKEKEADLTREPEMVRAYRDTWHLGIHSYLSYLRDRLMLAKELLADTGSVFVQISDENLHRVRHVLDEQFGADNFIGVISVQKTGGLAAGFLISTVDFLLWYGKRKEQTRYRPLFVPRQRGDTSLDRYDAVLELDGWIRRISREEMLGADLPCGSRRLQFTSLESANPTSTFNYAGREFAQRWKTNLNGLTRLGDSDRIEVAGDRIRYRRFVSDFPVLPVTDRWESLQIGTELLYAVQTAPTVLQRCILMTTRPLNNPKFVAA